MVDRFVDLDAIAGAILAEGVFAAQGRQSVFACRITVTSRAASIASCRLKWPRRSGRLGGQLISGKSRGASSRADGQSFRRSPSSTSASTTTVGTSISIQRYIFPGGCLPSKAALCHEFERAGLRLVSSEAFGHSYARTLAEWRRRFHSGWPQIAALGFDDRFRRLWDYYLSYCEAGFLEGVIDVGIYCLEHAPQPDRAMPMNSDSPRVRA